MKTLTIKSLIIVPVGIGLIFTTLINGWTLLTGDGATFLTYLNNYSRAPIEYYPAYYTFLIYLSAVLQIIAGVLLIVSFARREFLASKNAVFFKWGIFASILSVSFFGFMVRLLSNHGASAIMYFYVGLLYLCLWFVEQRQDHANATLFTRIKTLPIYFTLFYTMGFPGWQKLFNSAEVMGGYTKLFSNSFLSKLPGGIEPFIYFLGLMEIAVPVLVLVSLAKKEFLLGKKTHFLDLSLLVSVTTFVMLCFGLTVVSNYPGATNLVFYAVFTLGLYAYIDGVKRPIRSESNHAHIDKSAI